jgi:hypothetical protein
MSLAKAGVADNGFALGLVCIEFSRNQFREWLIALAECTIKFGGFAHHGEVSILSV